VRCTNLCVAWERGCTWSGRHEDAPGFERAYFVHRLLVVLQHYMLAAQVSQVLENAGRKSRWRATQTVVGLFVREASLEQLRNNESPG
jgi:hypothetical protein